MSCIHGLVDRASLVFHLVAGFISLLYVQDIMPANTCSKAFKHKTLYNAEGASLSLHSEYTATTISIQSDNCHYVLFVAYLKHIFKLKPVDSDSPYFWRIRASASCSSRS